MRVSLVASVLLAALSGCATTSPRMRLVSSNATGAAWAFVLEDRGRSAQLLVDGRPREGGCRRAGVMLRCELRGLFPGGHTLELHLAGGVLRRSAVLGAAMPRHPVLVRARDLSTVVGAAHAGADGIVIPAGLEPASVEELVEAAHKGATRVFVEGAPSQAEASAMIERYALDGVIGAGLEPSIATRFPSARTFTIDGLASDALSRHRAGEPLPLSALAPSETLLDTRGALGLGLALIAERGAIIDGGGFPLLGVRRRHKALRGEGKAQVLFDDGLRRAVRLTLGGDAVMLVGNAAKEAWTPSLEMPPVPIDLLGGPMAATGPTVPPGELAAILASPDPDRTKY